MVPVPSAVKPCGWSGNAIVVTGGLRRPDWLRLRNSASSRRPSGRPNAADASPSPTEARMTARRPNDGADVSPSSRVIGFSVILSAPSHPRHRGRVLLLEGRDRVALAQGEGQFVEALDEAALAVGVDIEAVGLAVG